MKTIQHKAELEKLAVKLGVRQDWHEPDEQGLTAKVFGRSFDNAGFWGSDYMEKNSAVDKSMEMFVQLLQDKKPVAEINLATLFAYACQTGKDFNAGKAPTRTMAGRKFGLNLYDANCLAYGRGGSITMGVIKHDSLDALAEIISILNIEGWSISEYPAGNGEGEVIMKSPLVKSLEKQANKKEAERVEKMNDYARRINRLPAEQEVFNGGNWKITYSRTPASFDPKLSHNYIKCTTAFTLWVKGEKKMDIELLDFHSPVGGKNGFYFGTKIIQMIRSFGGVINCRLNPNETEQKIKQNEYAYGRQIIDAMKDAGVPIGDIINEASKITLG